MRNVSAFLGVAMTLTMLTGAVEAQTTTDCTRIGNSLSCTTEPSGGGGAGGFLDSYLRTREQISREDERAANAKLLRQQTELLRLQTEQLRRQQSPAKAENPPPMPPLAVSPSENQATMMQWQRDNLFSDDPRFGLGKPKNDVYPLMLQAYGEDYEMTTGDVRTCLANELCGRNLHSFFSGRLIQIGVRP